VYFFDWDHNKAVKNLNKHGISFEQASHAFYDRYALLSTDSAHSQNEQRFWLFGTVQDKVLLVSHTREGKNIRIISARIAEPDERRFYEQFKPRERK
jgi:uncharacterized DUF497 family protein